MAWLALGLGLLLATTGMLKTSEEPLPSTVAARVNDRDIRMQDWARAVAAANEARRSPLNAVEQQDILQTLVDEELLLQFAEDLGLGRQIPAVRNGLTQAAMEALAGLPDERVDPAALRDFHAANAALFAQPEQRQARAWRHASADAAARAIGGQPIDLPARPMDERQLARWLGASLSAAIFATQDTGPLPEPVRIGDGWYRASVERIQPGNLPAFSDIDQATLERYWRRAQREQQLSRALDGLRQQARIQLAPQVAP